MPNPMPYKMIGDYETINLTKSLQHRLKTLYPNQEINLLSGDNVKIWIKKNGCQWSRSFMFWTEDIDALSLGFDDLIAELNLFNNLTIDE